MHADQMELKLKAVYSKWKTHVHLEEEALQLSPPLLLSVPQAYTVAKRRIILSGQETYGWKWGHDLRTLYPEYETEYPFKDICTMKDFVTNEDSIEALCWGYREFDFSSKQPRTRGSPLWQAFREVQGWEDAGLIWTNLARCDYQGGSVLNAPEELMADLSRLQYRLMAEELAILQPHVCLFLTGPRYDNFLAEVFPECQLTSVGDSPVRELARISHPSLPRSSFRTYHPKYLRLRKRWHILTQLSAIVCAET
jgi:hypothetical protein